MTYDDLTKALMEAGFSIYYREENATLICSSSSWPSIPQLANSFWVARRGNYWYVATWTPHVYRLEDAARVSELCIAWLRQHPKPAQYDFDECIKAEFQLLEIDSDDLPDE